LGGVRHGGRTESRETTIAGTSVDGGSLGRLRASLGRFRRSKFSIVSAETAAEDIGYVDSWGLAISPEQRAID
jgi:hypothetical protein